MLEHLERVLESSWGEIRCIFGYVVNYKRWNALSYCSYGASGLTSVDLYGLLALTSWLLRISVNDARFSGKCGLKINL